MTYFGALKREYFEDSESSYLFEMISLDLPPKNLKSEFSVLVADYNWRYIVPGTRKHIIFAYGLDHFLDLEPQAGEEDINEIVKAVPGVAKEPEHKFVSLDDTRCICAFVKTYFESISIDTEGFASSMYDFINDNVQSSAEIMGLDILCAKEEFIKLIHDIMKVVNPETRPKYPTVVERDYLNFSNYDYYDLTNYLDLEHKIYFRVTCMSKVVPAIVKDMQMNIKHVSLWIRLFYEHYKVLEREEVRLSVIDELNTKKILSTSSVSESKLKQTYDILHSYHLAKEAEHTTDKQTQLILLVEEIVQKSKPDEIYMQMQYDIDELMKICITNIEFESDKLNLAAIVYPFHDAIREYRKQTGVMYGSIFTIIMDGLKEIGMDVSPKVLSTVMSNQRSKRHIQYSKDFDVSENPNHYVTKGREFMQKKFAEVDYAVADTMLTDNQNIRRAMVSIIYPFHQYFTKACMAGVNKSKELRVIANELIRLGFKSTSSKVEDILNRSSTFQEESESVSKFNAYVRYAERYNESENPTSVITLGRGFMRDRYVTNYSDLIQKRWGKRMASDSEDEGIDKQPKKKVSRRSKKFDIFTAFSERDSQVMREVVNTYGHEFINSSVDKFAEVLTLFLHDYPNISPFEQTYDEVDIRKQLHATIMNRCEHMDDLEDFSYEEVMRSVLRLDPYFQSFSDWERPITQL
ncbi:hypothetical protein PCE1_001182 [Barthelona sp. PCE]